ncbi:MAG: S-adenosylmethionine decarboxylase [Pseudomonadota bacterium]
MIMAQVLADAYRCSPAINDEAALTSACKAAAQAVGATVMGEASARYVPHGLTVAVFLAESHIVLTTWPEHDLMLIDLMLCNPEMSPEAAIDVIVSRLCPDGEVVTHRIHRKIAAAP